MQGRATALAEHPGPGSAPRVPSGSGIARKRTPPSRWHRQWQLARRRSRLSEISTAGCTRAASAGAGGGPWGSPQFPHTAPSSSRRRQLEVSHDADTDTVTETRTARRRRAPGRGPPGPGGSHWHWHWHWHWRGPGIAGERAGQPGSPELWQGPAGLRP